MPSTCRRVRWCVSTLPTVRPAGRARSSKRVRTTRSCSLPASWAPSRRAPRSLFESSAIWAGIAFDNNSGTTGATAAQLDNLALGIFSPAVVGTSTDQYFVTTNAGSFASDNPVGTLTNFGGPPPADFGWEILTAQDVNLSITKTDGVDTAFPGGSLTYTITASNAGPQAVFDARVVDIFPETLTCSWTCAGSIGNICAASGTGDINDQTVDLAAGGSVTYTANCDVSPTATGTLENRAAIFAPGTAEEDPPGPIDNVAFDTDVIFGEFQVNTFTAGNQSVPDAGSRADGGFVVVWMDSFRDGFLRGVFGQRFDSTGTKIGADFQVNTITAGLQSDPRIAMRPDGAFVVVWSSFASVANGRNIYGQRFDSSGDEDGTGVPGQHQHRHSSQRSVGGRRSGRTLRGGVEHPRWFVDRHRRPAFRLLRTETRFRVPGQQHHALVSAIRLGRHGWRRRLRGHLGE